jgi:hypothetical protein
MHTIQDPSRLSFMFKLAVFHRWKKKTLYLVLRVTFFLMITPLIFISVFTFHLQMTARMAQCFMYSLQTRRFWVRNPVWERFTAPVQTGPEAHQACCILDAGSVFRGVMRPGRDAVIKE